MIFVGINKKVNLSVDNDYIKEKKLFELNIGNLFIMIFMQSYINFCIMTSSKLLYFCIKK